MHNHNLYKPHSPKKGMAQLIRRERIGGTYYVVHRDNGKYVARVKGISLKTAMSRFKSRGDIRENVRSFSLTNVREFVVTVPSRRQTQVRPPRRSNYQYWVEVDIEGSRAIARSNRHPAGYPVQQAREEALTNAYQIATGYAKSFVDVSDEDRIRTDVRGEGFVYYRAKT